MPPAFNLSQDQTLQFDLLQVNSINVGPIPSRFRPGTRRSASRHRWQKAALRCVSTSFVLAHPGFRHPYRHHPPGPQTTSTHTYRLRIVKERGCCDDVHVSAAAPRCRALSFCGVISKQRRDEIIILRRRHCNDNVLLFRSTSRTRLSSSENIRQLQTDARATCPSTSTAARSGDARHHIRDGRAHHT